MSMFGQPKPTASLSSTLLARKGTARPAMRPQGFGGFGTMPSHDDLGWNDMGEPIEAVPEATPVSAYAPAPVVPPVLRQREALEVEFEAPAVVAPQAEPMAEPVALAHEPTPEAAPEPAVTLSPPVKPVSVATARRIDRETTTRHLKAAFTLRLDHDRHLRLRLASALTNASAQQLVTEALDHFLQSLPEVEGLVRQLPPRAAH